MDERTGRGPIKSTGDETVTVLLFHHTPQSLLVVSLKLKIICLHRSAGLRMILAETIRDAPERCKLESKTLTVELKADHNAPSAPATRCSGVLYTTDLNLTATTFLLAHVHILAT